MDNPEGQVTYPAKAGRPGYLPALVHGVHVAFLSLQFYYSMEMQSAVKDFDLRVLSACVWYRRGGPVCSPCQPERQSLERTRNVRPCEK